MEETTLKKNNLVWVVAMKKDDAMFLLDAPAGIQLYDIENYPVAIASFVERNAQTVVSNI